MLKYYLVRVQIYLATYKDTIASNLTFGVEDQRFKTLKKTIEFFFPFSVPSLRPSVRSLGLH